jgi:CheY-like chemotaxis protein
MPKVLIIEDNADNLKIITYALERAGYEVLSAERGEDGIVMALQEPLEFIIMDINLPGIDGMEATRRIRASPSDGKIPIIAITSFAMVGDRERFMAAGCSGYLEKPVDPLTLVDKIHNILGIKS